MLKSLLATPISSDRLWEISFFLITLYLLFFPPLHYPQSYAVALGGGLFLLLFRTIPKESLQGLGRAGWVFLFFLPLSAFWSLQPGVTLQSAGFAFLATLLYWMVRSNDSAAQGRMEVGGLLLAGVAAFLALRQWLFGFEETRELLPHLSRLEFLEVEKAVFYHRATGPLVTPGALAALMILFIPLAFTLSMVGTGFKKWLFGFLTLLLGLALLATQSVGAFAALAAACLMVLTARKAWGGVASILVLGLAAMGGIVWSRGLEHWDISSFSGRLGLWSHAIQLFLQHPLLGSGLGTFGEAYQAAGFPLDSGASKYAHNILFQLLVETGLVGTGIFAWVVFSLARRFKVPSRWEGWGAMAGALAFLLFSLVDLPFQMPELIWFFALVLGRLEFKKTIHHSNSTPHPNPSPGWRPQGKSPVYPSIRKTQGARGTRHYAGFTPSPLRGEGRGEGEVEFLEKLFKTIQPLVPYVLLGIFLISGFWPPFHAWSFAMVAVSLWSVAALFGQKFEKVPLWIGLGALFLGLRAFFSPSALGAVWFLEIAGILLAFYLVLPCFEKPERFLRIFLLMGLAWAVKVWWASFYYAEPGLGPWLHFQYSDVKDWVIFPNPKQVGIFLIPLVLLFWRKPWTASENPFQNTKRQIFFTAEAQRRREKNVYFSRFWDICLNFAPLRLCGKRGFVTASMFFAAAAGLLTMIRLKASSSFAGLGAGLFHRVWLKSRVWAVALVLVLGAVLFAYRFGDSSSTSKDRLHIWMDSGKVWLESPWIGVGPGAFAGLYHQVKTPRAVGVNRYLMDARYSHNEFLELLTAFGVVGFGFSAFFLAGVWKRVREAGHRSALAGLGAASFVDFCLHTPLIALQGVGLFAAENRRKLEVTLVGGFLAVGLGMGLFGPPVFSEILKNSALADLSRSRFSQTDLRGLEAAEKLNAWDARYAAARADYLNQLFEATQDANWARRSDEAFERVLTLEQTDGQWRFERAQELTARLVLNSSPAALQAAQAAWASAEQAMPFNALIRYEEGLFLLHRGDRQGALLDFQKAAELESNYAAAWVNLGLLLKEKGDKAQARTAFWNALSVYNQWKDAQRISDTEKEMVDLPEATVKFLEQQTKSLR